MEPWRRLNAERQMGLVERLSISHLLEPKSYLVSGLKAVIWVTALEWGGEVRS
jgi:hypothetical protein